MSLTKVSATVLDITTVGEALTSDSDVKVYVDDQNSLQDTRISSAESISATHSQQIATMQQTLSQLPAITVSTDVPSGGKNGDVWFKVPQ